MRNLFRMILVLAILGIIIRVGFNFFVGGHEVSYNINSNDISFNINEVFTMGYKSSYRYEEDNNNYFYEVTIDDEEKPSFVFKLLGSYRYYQRLIKDIKYYEDDSVRCIYPVFRIHNNETDVLCLDNNIMVNYIHIKGENEKLDNFVSSLYNEFGYYHRGWFESDDSIESIEGIEVIKGNFVEDHMLVLWEYDRIRMLNKAGIFKRNLGDALEYDNDHGVLVDNFYIIPDYARSNDFNRILVTDVDRNTQKEILLIEPISYDSYIQGVINNKVYIFDRKNRRQYEINPEENTIVQVGDQSKGIKYFNGKWEKISAGEALDYKYFEIKYTVPDLYEEYNYDKIDNVFGDTDGYYYLYVENNDKTKVYRANKQKPEYLTLLFEVEKINNVRYVDDYLYFISEDTIYYYHDSTGIKSIVRSFELFFNKDNVYYIYSK